MSRAISSGAPSDYFLAKRPTGGEKRRQCRQQDQEGAEAVAH
jgi:hypothetical protein